MWEILLAALWAAAVLRGVDLTRMSVPIGWSMLAIWLVAGVAALIATLIARGARAERIARGVALGAAFAMLAIAANAAFGSAGDESVGAAVWAASLCVVIGGCVVPMLIGSAPPDRTDAVSAQPRRIAAYVALGALIALQAVQSRAGEGDALLMLTALVGLSLLASARAEPAAFGAVIAVYCAALLGAADEAWNAVTHADMLKPAAVTWSGQVFRRELLARAGDVLIVQSLAIATGRGAVRWALYLALALAYGLLAWSAAASS